MGDVQFAELLRSMDMVIASWKTDNLTIDEMEAQLSAAADIAEGKSNLSNFKSVTGLQFELLH